MPAPNTGLFIPTTNVWDVSQVYSTDITSPQFKELLVRLYQNVNAIALAVNLKDSGYYVQEEFVNGQVFFPNPTIATTTSQQLVGRQVYRKVINFGALPNAGTTSVAHDIPFNVNSTITFTRIYGASTDTTNFVAIPLPYASSTAANNVELSATTTNVVITTGINRSSFDTTYVILEYIKQ